MRERERELDGESESEREGEMGEIKKTFSSILGKSEVKVCDK